MFRSSVLALALLIGGAALVVSQEASKAQPQPKPPAAQPPAAQPPAAQPPAAQPSQPTAEAAPELEPVKQALQAYVAAFNKHDAAAAAAFWAPTAMYLDQQTGERSAGRAAVQADMEALFKASTNVRLAAQLDNLRLLKPDVALADGRTTLIVPGEEPTETAFTAVLGKTGDAWMFESVQEAAVAVPATPYEALKDLEWMVGRWVDDSDAASVETTVRWGTNRSFLVRSFEVKIGDEERQGTQVIGWDPRLRQIRSWVFDSDGSFGEGVWSQSGGDWLVRITRTLADGELASGTQVIQRVDDNTLHVQTVGQEVAGEPVPSTPIIRVVRAPAAAPSAGPAPVAPKAPTGLTPPAKK